VAFHTLRSNTHLRIEMLQHLQVHCWRQLNQNKEATLTSFIAFWAGGDDWPDTRRGRLCGM